MQRCKVDLALARPGKQEVVYRPLHSNNGRRRQGIWSNSESRRAVASCSVRPPLRRDEEFHSSFDRRCDEFQFNDVHVVEWDHAGEYNHCIIPFQRVDYAGAVLEIDLLNDDIAGQILVRRWLSTYKEGDREFLAQSDLVKDLKTKTASLLILASSSQ